MTLLAATFARPFLSLWVGPAYAPHAPLLRLFLVAAFPLVLSVHAQVAIGLGKVKMVAISPLVGSLVNVPLSYILTARLGVAGVIWGTVLTTLISNMLIPGVYLFRLLRDPAFNIRDEDARCSSGGRRALGAGRLDLLHDCTSRTLRNNPDLTLVLAALNLSLCVVAYIFGYLAVARGRADLVSFVRQIRQRWA